MRSAARRTNALHSLKSEQRPDYFRKSSNRIWTELKETLRHVSFNKCWYCESYVDREHGAIDHFRPKGKVRDTEHPGYWWLTYDWKNYRFSCTYCNSQTIDPDTEVLSGKWDRFPLLNESRRVTDPNGNIHEEQPTLLDPTKSSDPGLLSFYIDGSATPTKEDTEAPLDFERAEYSIIAYYLNHSFTRERRHDIFKRMEERVALVDRLLRIRSRLDTVVDAALIQEYDETIESQKQLLASHKERRAPYSAAADAFLRTFRSRNWVENMITAPSKE